MVFRLFCTCGHACLPNMAERTCLWLVLFISSGSLVISLVQDRATLQFHKHLYSLLIHYITAKHPWSSYDKKMIIMMTNVLCI